MFHKHQFFIKDLFLQLLLLTENIFMFKVAFLVLLNTCSMCKQCFFLHINNDKFRKRASFLSKMIYIYLCRIMTFVIALDLFNSFRLWYTIWIICIYYPLSHWYPLSFPRGEILRTPCWKLNDKHSKLNNFMQCIFHKV